MSPNHKTFKIKPITVNSKRIVQVVIDDHYKVNHRDYMCDELILNLVQELNGRRELPEAKTDRYSYFATLIEHNEKQYRLIWLI